MIIAQIGCGYWGPNLLRTFNNLEDCVVKYVVERDQSRKEFVRKNYPEILVYSDISQVLEDSSVNAVVIATPAGTHFDLAKLFLEAGKHILVEKPLSTKVEELDALEKIASRQMLTVMSGHTFIYNNAVRYVKKIIDEGSLGDIRYIYSQRLNLGRIRNDIDALWNFGPHDISIIQYWLDDLAPLSVHRHGVDFIQNGVDDVVFLNINYPEKIMANIHVSWLDPVKTRKMVVVGSKKMVVYDDVAEHKISIFDKGIDQKAIIGERMDYDNLGTIENFKYRSGDIQIPKIEWVEPLIQEAKHFLHCIQNKIEPLTGIQHTINVIKILESSQKPS
jgi:predicted dehydrogenase